MTTPEQEYFMGVEAGELVDAADFWLLAMWYEEHGGAFNLGVAHTLRRRYWETKS